MGYEELSDWGFAYVGLEAPLEALAHAGGLRDLRGERHRVLQHPLECVVRTCFLLRPS
jgi:hypothetical protein